MSEITDIHEPFMRYLRDKGIEFTRARSDKASTIENGWPDFSLHHPCFPTIFLEMKDGKKPLSAAQKRVHQRLLAKGHIVLVCRSIGHAVDATEAWSNGGLFKTTTAIKPDNGLRQHMGLVFEQRNGQWQSIRKCGTYDSHLPSL